MEEFSGAVVYHIKDGQVYYLVIQQRFTKHFGFPKGHVELNESKEETAIREVLEETGINIELINEHSHSIQYISNSNKKEVTYFLAKALNTNINFQVEEVLQAHWLTEEETFIN